MDPLHPYQLLSLFTVGVVLAIVLIAAHTYMLVKPAAAQEFLKKFPRNQVLGQILLGIGLAWFWLLIAPLGLGKLSSLAMDLGEFEHGVMDQTLTNSHRRQLGAIANRQDRNSVGQNVCCHLVINHGCFVQDDDVSVD